MTIQKGSRHSLPSGEWWYLLLRSIFLAACYSQVQDLKTLFLFNGFFSYQPKVLLALLDVDDAKMAKSQSEKKTGQRDQNAPNKDQQRISPTSRLHEQWEYTWARKLKRRFDKLLESAKKCYFCHSHLKSYPRDLKPWRHLSDFPLVLMLMMKVVPAASAPRAGLYQTSLPRAFLLRVPPS